MKRIIDEPFACDVPNCLMKCSTEDRLEHHKKSHDMRLVVNNKLSNYVDQTPTPTRFIRNCEEVGLFQDLQNVNPFDETFRKAIENPKSINMSMKPGRDGIALDDTLHTPIVFPPTCEQRPAPKIPDKCSSCSSQPNPPTQIEKVERVAYESNPHIFLLDKNVALKLPISKVVSTSRPTMKVFHPKAFSVMANNLAKSSAAVRSQKNAPKSEGRRNNPDLKEINRMAAVRSRQKKKHYMAYMEELNKSLADKIKNLEAVITELKNENTHLKLQLSNNSQQRFEPGSRMEVTAMQFNSKTTSSSDVPPQSSIAEEQRISFYSSIPINEPEISFTPEAAKAVKKDFILRKPIKKRSVPQGQC